MKQHPIRDEAITKHLSSIAHDGMDLFTAADAQVRIAVVHATAMVHRMIANHKLAGIGATALGQAYITALLASSTLKDEERISISAELDGPIEGCAVDANSHGQVRGYLRNTGLADETNGGRAQLYGEGILSVMRVDRDRTVLSNGQVAWIPGDLVENMAMYYAQSEQTATLIDVDFYSPHRRGILGAAGILVQALPGASVGALDAMGHALSSLGSFGQRFAEGGTSTTLITDALGDWDPQLIGSRPAEFYCGCNHERFARFLSGLPESEKDDILRNGPIPIKTTCHNCNSTYRYERPELERLFG